MRYLTLLLSLVALVSSCYSEPEFPVEPYIEFRNISFVDAPDVVKDGIFPADTLKVTVFYRDGDGNLGMFGDPIEPFIYKFDGKYILLGDSEDLPKHNCTNYLSGFFEKIGSSNSDSVFVPSTESDNITDTLYIQQNPLYYNFLLDFYVIEDGVENFFDVVEFNYPICGYSPSGQFKLNQTNETKPISGTITYKFSSSGIIPYFLGKLVKVKVRIVDRAGNISNIAESPPFTLTEIKQ